MTIERIKTAMIVALIAIINAMAIYHNLHHPKDLENARYAGWVKSWLRIRQGWTSYKDRGGYSLFSADGGKAWYEASAVVVPDELDSDGNLIRQHYYTDFKLADKDFVVHLDKLDGEQPWPSHASPQSK